MRKLKRINGDYWLGGVCAGIAYSLDIPTWVVRLVWFCALFFYGLGMVLYILLWFFMPAWEKDPQDYKEIAD